jgi:DNA repair protein RecO
MVQENQANHALFRLLLSSMHAGTQQAVQPSLVRYFEIWSLKLNGLLPNYAYCSNCGKCVKDEGFFAWIEAGQARCSECAQGRGFRVGAQAAAVLEEMMKFSPEKFMVRPMAKDAGADIERLAQRLLGFHLEKQLKSYRILREELQGE